MIPFLDLRRQYGDIKDELEGAVLATLRVFYVALGGERWTWQPLFAVLAVVTMVLGAVAGLTQRDVKRMLAYSSIAHAGFLLTAVVGAWQTDVGKTPTSVASILFYLIAYGFAVIAAFAIVTMVRDRAGEAILAGTGNKASDQLRPRVLYHDIIENITDQHAVILNRNRQASMIDAWLYASDSSRVSSSVSAVIAARFAR